MFPKISSSKPLKERTILEMDLFRFERRSGVFMRGIRAPRQNLSEKGGMVAATTPQHVEN
jgi:hypothetical protein